LALNVFVDSLVYTAMDSVERELEELYRSDYSKFETVLAGMTRDREAARDAVQQAFATALARRDQFRGEGSLQAWVWKIALRIATRRTRGPVTADVNFEPEIAAPPLEGDLANGIRALSPRRRLFVFLRYFADLSYDEIAEACGVSRGTVAATLAQARAELEPLLENSRARAAEGMTS
jgi:RNA polymerase sigma-70 factor (ECF subfamily)